MSADDNGERHLTKVTRKGQVTIPKPLREEFGLQAGDKIHWEKADDGIRLSKATQSAGRGMLVDESVSAEQREAMATEMEAEIREQRRTEWQP